MPPWRRSPPGSDRTGGFSSAAPAAPPAPAQARPTGGPYGVAVDGAGRLCIADAENHRCGRSRPRCVTFRTRCLSYSEM
ncbi:hypothetical protein AB0O22_15410 [Streptomyces sp. NPDC091204]|uniref:hypothetical protein n=1 Tax=Streptomyces sp. NPDC091204 TaxID=3155299 RepID=UPI003416D9BE